MIAWREPQRFKEKVTVRKEVISSFMGREHNNVWCEIYPDRVIVGESGGCSLCGAVLHELRFAEAIRLVDLFEEMALARVRAEPWDAEQWLFGDEIEALRIARAVALPGRENGKPR
jgi:hypothetical protein